MARGPNVRWRHAVAAAEASIEIRQIAKPARECYRADSAAEKMRIAQHSIRLQEALAQHEFRIRGSFNLEQSLNIALPEAVGSCNEANREVAAAKIFGDVTFIARSARSVLPLLLNIRTP